LSHKSLM